MKAECQMERNGLVSDDGGKLRRKSRWNLGMCVAGVGEGEVMGKTFQAEGPESVTLKSLQLKLHMVYSQ